MRFQQMLARNDRFCSRFFDSQAARKYLVHLDDGAAVETTIYEHSLGGTPTDVAIDISTMVGCPMGCRFCASATQPFVRALTVSEIVGQVSRFLDAGELRAPQITCSFQGIGEPSAIPGLIIEASERLLQLDPRVVISVSSMAGNPAGVLRITTAGFPIDNFQLSLGGAREDAADRLMSRSPGPVRIAGLARRITAMPHVLKTKVNLVLVRGVNDGPQTIDALVDLFAGTDIIVKLSSLNPTRASAAIGLQGEDRARVDALVEQLLQRGVDSYAYGSFGDITVSCGQLLSV